MAYEEYKEQMKSAGVPKNFTNWAKSYFAQGGMSHDQVDVEGYYDPSLSYAENKENFRRTFPIDTETANMNRAREKEVQHQVYRGEAETRLEERREAKEKKMQMIEEQKKKAKQPSEFDEAVRETEPQKKEPNLLDKLMGKGREIKSKYEEHQAARLKERQYAAKKRLESASERYAVSATERKAAALESEVKAYEKSQNPLFRLANMVKGAGGGESPMKSLLMGRGASAGTGESGIGRALFGSSSSQSGSGSPFRAALFGEQPKKRGKYVMIIQNGVARRVRVPDEGVQNDQNLLNLAAGRQREERSLLGSLLSGRSSPNKHEKPGMLAQLALGGNKGKERPSMLKQMLMGGGKAQGREKQSPLAKMALSSKKSGLLNMKMKKRWY